MNIAIDVSPLKTGNFLSHRVRGTGFYIENLKNSLLKYFPDNKYTYFNHKQKLGNDIDIVHYPYFEPFFLSLPIFKKHKTIVTVHDLTPFVFPKEFPSGIKGKIKWQIQKFALKKADKIITDSFSSKKDIVKYCSIQEEKIEVIYLAAGEEFKKVQSSEFRAQSLRKKYGLPEKFALYVGDATWNKNLPRLIKAIQKINVPLVMVGKALADNNFDKSNPWNKDISEVQKLIDNDKNILILGFVPQEDLIMLYNISAVFVMPSLYEGFGLPILEAMSCGCPVVTTKEGSIKEIAGDAAFFIDAYTIDNIVLGIKKVFEDKSIQNMLSDKGLAQAKKFSWQKTAKETAQVYKTVMDGR